ncbi:MAG TPA: hypothetical protein VJT80_24225 [Steroidobacteraceae bacterium]|nr:hypothetical protein [Steroidobacteraceae bacterium]
MPKQAHAKKSLLEGLLNRFGSRKEPPAATGPLRPFQAISIYRGVVCCELARKFSEHRFLVRDAPPLPLAGCSMGKSCQCKYIKHRDRRAESRRLIDFGMAARLFDGRERRTRDGGRRNSD